MRQRDWNRLLTSLAFTAPIALVARADTYLTENQAAAVLFPGLSMEPRWMDLTSEETLRLAKVSDTRVPTGHIRVWWGPHKEALFVDQVLGKHENITYAVAVDPQGRVRGIEILDYRETFGSQVRDASWRKHFEGKTARDPLKLDKDIPNISGATLSSKHITDGVRRVLQTYEILKAKV